MTEPRLFDIPCSICRLPHFTTGCIIGSTSVSGSFITIPQLDFIFTSTSYNASQIKKSKGKKAKGATVSVSLMKLAKKDARCSQVSVTPVQDLGLITEEEGSATSRDRMSQKLETMMEMLVDLSHRIQAIEYQQMEKAASPTALASPSTSHADRRWTVVQCHPSLTHEPDLCEAARLRVA